MHTLLPAIPTPADVARICKDEDALRPGVLEVLRRNGLPPEPRRYPSGSVPVYAIRDHVLKLFPPGEEVHHGVERAALIGMSGRLPIPTPHLHATGELDGWSWLLMQRLDGLPASEAWPDMSAGERDRFAERVGGGLAALHALPPDGLDALRLDWEAFVAQRRGACLAQQRARGLAAEWLNQIPGWLERPSDDDHRRVPLHTEVMREHLLVHRGARGWELSGLVDFEPAVIGAPEYELASVGIFVTAGDGPLLRRLLLAYGYPFHALDETLQARAMTWALLHRYSNLAWYLRRVPAGPEITSLDQLAARWWALG